MISQFRYREYPSPKKCANKPQLKKHEESWLRKEVPDGKRMFTLLTQDNCPTDNCRPDSMGANCLKTSGKNGR